MKKITKEMIENIYAISKKVHKGEIEKKEALDIMENETGMNRTSAAQYINNFQMMIKGTIYKRTMSKMGTEYYLINIYDDYGDNSLKLALEALRLHFTYYENLRFVKLKGLREIHSKYYNLLSKNSEIIYPDEIEDVIYFEGTKRRIVVNAYERDNKARKKCIEHYGYKCVICNFDFEQYYGEIGKEFIHVHHLKSLAEIGEAYKVNPIDDLRPVCPNCHAMLHKRKPAYEVEELIGYISDKT